MVTAATSENSPKARAREHLKRLRVAQSPQLSRGEAIALASALIDLLNEQVYLGRVEMRTARHAELRLRIGHIRQLAEFTVLAREATARMDRIEDIFDLDA